MAKTIEKLRITYFSYPLIAFSYGYALAQTSINLFLLALSAVIAIFIRRFTIKMAEEVARDIEEGKMSKTDIDILPLTKRMFNPKRKFSHIIGLVGLVALVLFFYSLYYVYTNRIGIVGDIVLLAGICVLTIFIFDNLYYAGVTKEWLRLRKSDA